MSKLYAYAAVERRGLCNMLYPWARSVIFARDHHCEVIGPGWVKINRLGPLLRGERDKRYYLGQFTNKGYISGFRKWWLLSTQQKISEEVAEAPRSGIVVFNELRGYLADFPDEAEFLNGEIARIASPSILEAVNELPKNFIGVHIRRGDFARIGQALPEEYYIRAIARAKEIVGDDIPVLVFSDASPEELTYLHEAGKIKLMPKAPALQDMLSLAKATVLIGTNLSTFSEWAAFLGGNLSLWSKDAKPPKVLSKVELV